MSDSILAELKRIQKEIEKSKLFEVPKKTDLGGGGGGGTPATTVTDETTWGITPAVGSDTKYARQDHTHGSPAQPLLTLPDHDHSGDAGDGGQFAIENLTTAETDTDLRLAPDGAGGVEWGAGGGGSEIGSGAYASLPAGTEKDLYFPTDGFSIYRKGASAWAPWGPIFPFTKPPPVSDFTWENQNTTATAVETYGGIVLTTSASASGVQGLYKAAPVSTPWKLTVAFLANGGFWANYISFGIFFRQSSDGKLVFFRHVNFSAGDYLFATEYTDVSHEAGNYDYDPMPVIMRQPFWRRIEDNGTNRICSFSSDGINFIPYHTVGRTDFLTADQIGFAAIGLGGIASVMTLLSWKVE